MSGIEQQKNINFGAKLTGKIAGGIYLSLPGSTAIPPGGWARIGTGVDVCPPFILMPIQPVVAPTSAGINDYFELQNPLGFTATQALWYRYGKRAVHYCSYAITIQSRDANIIGVRVSNSSSFYPQSVRTFAAPANINQAIKHTFPLVVPSEEIVFLELSATNVDNVLTIAEAYLSVYE